jgi:hypothetical protein
MNGVTSAVRSLCRSLAVSTGGAFSVQRVAFDK